MRSTKTPDTLENARSDQGSSQPTANEGSYPALADDLLDGAEEIASFLGWKRRRVYHLADSNRIPVFKVGNSLCARRSSLLAWVAEREAQCTRPKNG